MASSDERRGRSKRCRSEEAPPARRKCLLCGAGAQQDRRWCCSSCEEDPLFAAGLEVAGKLSRGDEVKNDLWRKLDNEEASTAALCCGNVAAIVKRLPLPLLASARLWEAAFEAAPEQAAHFFQSAASGGYGAPARTFLCRRARPDLWRSSLGGQKDADAAQVLRRLAEKLYSDFDCHLEGWGGRGGASVLSRMEHSADLQCCACLRGILVLHDEELLPPEAGGAEARVWQCSRGHLLCHACDGHLGPSAACPLCRDREPRVRNLLAERLRDGQPRRCRHCNEWHADAASAAAHEPACLARLLRCALCQANVPLSLLDGHLQRHAAEISPPPAPPRGSPPIVVGINRFASRPLTNSKVCCVYKSDLVFLLRDNSQPSYVVRCSSVRRDAKYLHFVVEQCGGGPASDLSVQALLLVSSRDQKVPMEVATVLVMAPWAYRYPRDGRGACCLQLPGWITDAGEAQLEIRLRLHRASACSEEKTTLS
jgi:hypothetical protein